MFKGPSRFGTGRGILFSRVAANVVKLVPNIGILPQSTKRFWLYCGTRYMFFFQLVQTRTRNRIMMQISEESLHGGGQLSSSSLMYGWSSTHFAQFNL